MKWNKRDVSFWKDFENQASLIKKKSNTSHSNTQSFNCLVFWKQKVTRCKIKMVFSWFFVSILKSDFGYIFWWSVMRWHCCEFQKQDAQALSRKVVSFLSIYFINNIITSSLIHEVLTLIEKLFQFWQCHLSVQIAYLIEKEF